MSLNEYIVPNDKFEPEDRVLHFCFPCFACRHQEKNPTGPHCGKCGHNNVAIEESDESEQNNCFLCGQPGVDKCAPDTLAR